MENPSLFNKNNRPESELFSKSKTQNFNNTLLTTENNSQQDYWKILIVDDDEDVHSVTKLGLSDFEYKNKQIHFLHCYSAESARKILSAHSDIAIILLDVVMESITAGLDLVKYIREDIENKQITIILRTGQAGSAPEREVIIRYDINDFKSKTELTIEKLTTSIVAGLRSYEAISSLEKQNKNLEQIVFQRTTEIRLKNIELEKLSIVASETDNSVVIADADGIIEWVNLGFTKLFEFTMHEFIEAYGANIIVSSANPEMPDAFIECINNRTSVTYVSNSETKSRKKIWTQTTLTPIFSSEQILLKLVAIDSDITTLKEAEEKILKQKTELEEKNLQIMDSISYAQLIQQAILPTKLQLQNLLPQHFVIYYPRDIISGDFYWLYEKNNYIYLAVVDCTGHGVPGALMSMLGNSFLNEIVSGYAEIIPSEILDLLNEKVVSVLKQTDAMKSQEDGMDISLCRINGRKKELMLACANHSILVFQENQDMCIFEEHSFSIGGMTRFRKNHKYNNNVISLQNSTSLYMFSDGITDQFNSTNTEKLGTDRFIDIIKDIQKNSFSEQADIIEKIFQKWKENQKQMDDITLVGVRI